MTFKGPRQTMLRSFQRWMILAHWPIFFRQEKKLDARSSDLYSYSFPPFLAVFFLERIGVRGEMHTRGCATHSLSTSRSFESLSERGCVKKLFLIFDTSLLYDSLILRPRYLMSGYMATSYPHHFPVPWARGKLGVICTAGDLTGIELPRQEKHGF